MIQEVWDATIPNRFSELTEIADQIGGPIDFSGAMNPANVYLFGEHGGFIFEWKGPETYEVHTMIASEGRGKWGFQAARQAMRMMAAHGATHIWARIHPDKREVAILAAMSGFRETGTHTLDGIVWRIFNWRA